MKKILVVFGTRPEAIKMAPLIQELNRRSAFQPMVCVTGQHREMLAQVLGAFSIMPDVDLNIMLPGQDLSDLTARLLQKLRDVMESVRPEIVLVHGDTTSTFAAALAAFYLQIPVGHVEAGLRTGDLAQPFPEEMNRQVVDRLSRYHFAPTARALENLRYEDIAEDGLFLTGNTVIDAMQTTVSPTFTHPEWEWARGSRLILLTAHRRENWGEPMHRMFRAVRRIAEEHADVKVLFPMHPNPGVRAIAARELAHHPQIHCVEPFDVVEMHNFESRCAICLTDSGGMQEECPAYGKPVLVMREKTERQEGVDAGVLRLVGTDEQRIYQETSRLLEDPAAYEAMARAVSPFGDGHASERIADALESSGR